MIYFYIAGLSSAIPLVFKLVAYSIIFKKPHNFYGSFSFKLRKGCAGLLCFVEAVKPLFNFSTSTEQQKEIIFYIVKLGQLIDDAFDNQYLSPQNFREIILKKINNGNVNIQEILNTFSFFNAPSSNFYNQFLDNIFKTWETHRVRDVRQKIGTKFSAKEVLEAAENRGSFYFLAVTYALNPTNWEPRFEDSVKFAGSWFQIIDDYSDQKKDIGRIDTPFTIDKNNSFSRFLELIKKYEKEIGDILKHKHPLIKFMKRISVLWLFLSKLSLSDWHN